MAGHRSLQSDHADTVARLVRALDLDDRASFDAALAALNGARSAAVSEDLRAIADTLQTAMGRFRDEFRLSDIAERELPDAMLRLKHVLDLTHDAAHRTIHQIECCVGIVTRIGHEAEVNSRALAGAGPAAADQPGQAVAGFLDRTVTDCAVLRGHLGEAMLAQAYQDLSGQIIGGVITLVRDVEGILGEMLRVCGKESIPQAAPDAPARTDALDEALARGQGPAVPGVTRDAVANQDDVDALLAELDL